MAAILKSLSNLRLSVEINKERRMIINAKIIINFTTMKTATQTQKIDIKSLLKTHFGYDNFLANQEEIINNVLDQNDTIAIMPTGGGKSLCFQLPVLALDGTAIVISPLIYSLHIGTLKIGFNNLKII